jgi:hypothetical protein
LSAVFLTEKAQQKKARKKSPELVQSGLGDPP